MEEGLFGQDTTKVRKRAPGKVSAPKDGIIQEVRTGYCGRSFPDGVCDRPQASGACYPVPAGREAWGFVTPCGPCQADIQPFVDIMPPWAEAKREDREPLYHFLVENWPLIVQKAASTGDPECPKSSKKSKNRSSR